MRIALGIGFCLLAALPARAQFAPSDPGRPADITASRPAFGNSLGTNTPQSSGSIHPAVARIVAPGDGSISYGSGTLVYADSNWGLVVTNWHVVNEATGPISVHFPDGFYSLGKVQNVDKDWDLAVLAIRKPNAKPVPIASEPPRQGDMLTIAGYGSGNYRAASGPCTQYVAPGLDFPYEMVEVAVSARQGDSGGPIFNARGELAGVLFGEGNGRTSGSYCGRVRWFLTSVAPRASMPSSTIAVAPPLEAVPARTASISTTAATTRSYAEPANVTAMTAAAPPPVVSDTPLTTWRTSPSQEPAPAVADSVPLVASTQATPAGHESIQIGWHDIAGETLADQAKTILAIVGVLAIFLQTLRWLSREEAAA